MAVALAETPTMTSKRYRVLSIAIGIAAFLFSTRQRLQRTSVELRRNGRSEAVGGSIPKGNGRGAKTPEEIPAKGWWEIAKRTLRKFSENELMSEAASVTFFALLSLFPAVTAIVSIYGLFTDPTMIGEHLSAASGFIPSGGMDIVSDQVKRLTSSPSSGLSFGAIFGVLAALWSANQGSKAMLSALNDVYGEQETRGFFRTTATALSFTVGGVTCLVIAVGAVVLLPIAFQQMGLTEVLDLVARIARWPILLLGIVLGLAILYRYGPSRHPAKWRWVTWGSAIAAVLWVGLSIGFSWYVEHFGNYNKTYGSLGAIIGFMTWIWLSSTVLLLGAQINAEMETQTGRNTTSGNTKIARRPRAIAARY